MSLTIWFSLNETEFQENYTAALIAHADKMTPLEELKHDYHKFYGGSLHSPRTYINPIKGQDLFDFHFNLITTEILYTIFDTFQAFKSKPDGDMFSSSGYPKSLKLKRRFCKWEEYINIAGIPVTILDTAGIRETKDKVEKIGIKIAKETIDKADLVLLIIVYL